MVLLGALVAVYSSTVTEERVLGMKKLLLLTFSSAVMGFVGVAAGVMILGDKKADTAPSGSNVNAALRKEIKALRKSIDALEKNAKRLEEQVALNTKKRLTPPPPPKAVELPKVLPAGDAGIQALANKIRDLEEKIKTGSIRPTTVEDFEKQFQAAFAAKDGQAAWKAMAGIVKLKDFPSYMQKWGQMREAKWLGLSQWERRGHRSAELLHWALTTSALGLNEEATKEFQRGALWNLNQYEKDATKVSETLAIFIRSLPTPEAQKENRGGRRGWNRDPYRSALSSLSQVKDASAIQPLGAVLGNTKNPDDVRLSALRGLTWRKDDAARSIIESHVNDPNEKIREKAQLSVKKNSPPVTGYLITSVDKDLPAAKAGLLVGHIITSINGKAIQSGRDIIATVRAAQDGQVLPVVVHDGSSTKTLNLTIAGRRIGVFGDSVKVGK